MHPDETPEQREKYEQAAREYRMKGLEFTGPRWSQVVVQETPKGYIYLQFVHENGGFNDLVISKNLAAELDKKIRALVTGFGQ